MSVLDQRALPIKQFRLENKLNPKVTFGFWRNLTYFNFHELVVYMWHVVTHLHQLSKNSFFKFLLLRQNLQFNF